MSGTRFSFREKPERGGHQLPGRRASRRLKGASVGRRPLVIGGTMSGTRFSFREERHQLPGAPREPGVKLAREQAPGDRGHEVPDRVR